MKQFADWLELNITYLIDAALAELSQDEIQQSQARKSVTLFFQSVYEAARRNDHTPLYQVLDSWVASRSAPVEGELTRLIPVAMKFKQVNTDQICKRCTSDLEAVDLLMAVEKIYDPAIIYLSNLETDALLQDMRQRLSDAQAELDRLDKSKSDFIEVAAHELRTPITLVEGYTNMLTASLPGLVNEPAIAPLLDGISGGVKRLREIIRDMLDVSLISLGMIELHWQPTWLRHLMQALTYSMKDASAQRQVELIIEHETIPSLPIYGDPERLLQVFQKIVSNAIKYTPDGGQIIVTARQLSGFTDIMVIDNGIGIEPENLTRIFNMFSGVGDSSLHSSSKVKFRGGGPGLGLFISKGIIEAHGGNIWAESPGYDEVNCPGSTFHIMIPMKSSFSADTFADN
jgi:signal transduction histidine kinase